MFTYRYTNVYIIFIVAQLARNLSKKVDYVEFISLIEDVSLYNNLL